MKFTREKLKLTPLCSTPDSPTPHSLESTLCTTLLVSSTPSLTPTTTLLSTLLSTMLPPLSRPTVMVLPPPLLELSTLPMLESASTMKVPRFPANCSTQRKPNDHGNLTLTKITCYHFCGYQIK